MTKALANLASTQRTFQGRVREIERPTGAAAKGRVLGLGRTQSGELIRGAGPAGLGDIIDAINANKRCPIYNMPVIEQVRWTIGGPMLDADVTRTFGAQIDPFGSGRSPAGVDFVETTMAQTGQLQTYMLACAIGFHVEPEPLCFTVQGNAWSRPVAAVQPPPSPDVFTDHDRDDGAISANVADGSEIFLPAVLEWGWWANKLLWCLVRGFDLRWKVGQHTNIMDEQARHTAFMPPNAQEGSASSSQVDIIDFVRQTNERYDSLGTALDFLKIDFLRIGSVGTGTANVGIFRPSRAFELVGATYGGMDLRSMLKGTSEFRNLTVPYIITPGVPIGLYLQESDSIQAGLMRRYLSITQGQNGAVPPQITDDANILAGVTATGANVMLERTLDATPANVPQQVDTSRVVFKGGEFKLGLLVKGFEVDSEWGDVLKSNPDLKRAVLGECECDWAGR